MSQLNVSAAYGTAGMLILSCSSLFTPSFKLRTLNKIFIAPRTLIFTPSCGPPALMINYLKELTTSMILPSIPTSTWGATPSPPTTITLIFPRSLSNHSKLCYLAQELLSSFTQQRRIVCKK